MENTKKVATVRKEGVSDSGKPDTAINEGNREGCRFIVVYKDSTKFLYYCYTKIKWMDGDKTEGHYLTELPITDYPQFVVDTNPVLVPENYF